MDPEPPTRVVMDGLRIATFAVLAADTLVVILLALFLVTTVQGQRQTNECYQGLLNDVIAYINVAAQAGRTDRQAQRELLTVSPDTPDDGRVALDRYLAQLDEADRTRSTNPIPVQRCAR